MAMTQAERLRLLSGTGHGELPKKSDQVLDIPFFMKTDWKRTERKIIQAEEAKTAAIISKERRKARQAKEKERRKKQGIIIGIFWVVTLLLIGAIESGVLF